MDVATLNPVGKTLIIHVGKKPDVQSIYYNAFKVDSASQKRFLMSLCKCQKN